MKDLGMQINREDMEIVRSCLFNAPRAELWRAYTDPELIPKWWGPYRYRTSVEELELKKGGSWRFIHTNDDGENLIFFGKYTEIVELELLSYTFSFDSLPSELIETVRFEIEGRGDQTKITTMTSFQDVDDLDAMVDAGMRKDATESMERLSLIVETS